MNYYQREKDGTTYFYHHGVLVSTPTNSDGTFSTHEINMLPVDEFVDPLTDDEIKEITDNLK